MQGYEVFKEKVYKLTGINLSSYKERQKAKNRVLDYPQ